MATVREILARKGNEVVTAHPDETVLAAAQLMNTRGIGALPVTEEGEVIGILSERDIMRRVVAMQRDPAATTVRAVMTPSPVTTATDTTMDECAELMTVRRIRHLPVMAGGKLAGIVTIGDLLAWQLAEQASTIAHLNNYVYDIR